MSSKIKVDTIENVAGSGNVSLGSGHNLVVPGNNTTSGNATVGGTLGITGNATFTGDIIKSTSGTSNFAAGVNAGNSIVSGGDNNVCVGDEAGTAITTGSLNVAIGSNSLKAAATTNNNTAVGAFAMDAGTGSNNTAIGSGALGSATFSSSNNTAMGYDAGNALTTGSRQTIIGYQAGKQATTATNGVYIGYLAAYSVTTGGSYNCSYIGDTAGYSNQTGNSNTVVGQGAYYAGTGSQNTMLGQYSGALLTSGNKNTFIGRYSGNAGGLDLRTSSNNIVLSDGDLTPHLHIDSSARFKFPGTAPVLGGQANFYSASDWAISVNRPSSASAGMINFYNGSSYVGGITTSTSATQYNTSSDYRLKENVVTDWDATTRLKQLKPSRFNFKENKDVTVDGFLAHEVSSIIPEAVNGTKDDTRDIGVIKDKDGVVLAENVLQVVHTEGKKETTDADGNKVSKYASDTTWTKTKTENIYQGIDQSKLVPLLVKSLQEALVRIEALESK